MTKSTRNIEIAGQWTTFRLEDAFWRAATDYVRGRETSLDQLFTEIIRRHGGERDSKTSAIRTFLICRLHDRAMETDRQKDAA